MISQNKIRAKDLTLGIIGYGKMGSSLIRGATRSGILVHSSIKAYDMDPGKLEFAAKDGVQCSGTLEEVVNQDVLLVAVKPKDMAELLEKMSLILPKSNPLLLSIVAGYRLRSIEEKLGDGRRIIRIMPNIAASVNEAASVYVPNKWASASDINFVDSFLGCVGKTFLLNDEKLIDAVTGISGSGPAYFFYMMKALETVGSKVGLPQDLVRILVAQTCRGSGTMVLESTLSQDQLISMVASPGGTTEEALKVMESKGLSAIMIDAVVAAIEKSKKMSRG